VLYPEAQEQAQLEIDAVVGSDRLPEWGDREKLPFVRGVIEETLRCVYVTPWSLETNPVARDADHGYRRTNASLCEQRRRIYGLQDPSRRWHRQLRELCSPNIPLHLTNCAHGRYGLSIMMRTDSLTRENSTQLVSTPRTRHSMDLVYQETSPSAPTSRSVPGDEYVRVSTPLKEAYSLPCQDFSGLSASPTSKMPMDTRSQSSMRHLHPV